MTLAAVVAFAAEWLQLLATEVIYSLVLALTGIAALRLLRVRVTAVHHAVWALVLLRMILPPGWGSSWSLRSLLAGLGGLLDTADTVVDSAPALPLAEAAVSTAVPAAPAAISLWQPLLFFAWCTGALIIGILVYLRFRSYRQAASGSVTVSDQHLLQLVAQWRHRFAVRREVRLVSSDACLSPFTTGLIRPVIFLPEPVAAWSPAAIEPVIAHEMAHIRRWDELWTILANIVLALYFFNPIAWLAVRRLGQAREQRSDELVLASGEISPRDYGRSLVEVLRLNVFGTGVALVGLSEGKERVQMRLSSILSGVRSSRKRSLVGVLTTIVLALFLLPMSAVESTAERAESDSPSVVGHLEDGRAIYRFVVGGKITEPQKGRTPVQYPAEAAEAGIQGHVILEVVIDEQGKVVDTEVVRGQPYGLTKAAVGSVAHWQFSPATLDGEPVAVKYALVVRFQRDLAQEDLNRLRVAGQHGGRDFYHFTVGGPLSEPQKLETTEPEYTAAAREANISGRVILAVVIDEKGRVVDVKVARGLPLGLTESAIKAVRQWRFSPAALDGEPVMVKYVVAVSFPG